MKRFIGWFFVVILLSSRSTISSSTSRTASEMTATETVQPILSSTVTPVRSMATPSLNPTDVFITQVMGEKYAAQTQYALLPTITPTPSIPSSSKNCQPGDLQTSFHSNGAGGHIILEIGVKNISQAPCFLPSWPAIHLHDRSGNHIDVTYDYIFLNANPSNSPTTQESNPGQPNLYGLTVNQDAVLLLPWGDWCQPPVEGGVVIRMFLLGAKSWIDVPTDISGGGYCDDPSSPSTVDVIGFGY